MINCQFREQFPFFQTHEWSYLDSAATTLKPQVLLEATEEFYCSAGSVHRSQYDIEQTKSYELARELVARRFNAEAREAVIWTSGTTHSINLVAHGLSEEIEAGDEIIISVAEHHANFIPWQQLAMAKGAKLIVLPLNEKLQLSPALLQERLSSRTKIVALNLVSNVSGIRQPVEDLIPLIRRQSSAYILLDIAQAVCSEKVDVQKLDADFYAFSAHKMYGPTGVGVLMGKLQSLEKIRPLVFGGKMLEQLTHESLTLAKLPYRLEAGTPNVAGIIGFGKVLDWLNEWDFEALNRGLYQLSATLYKRLKTVENLQIFGNGQATPTVSFKIHGCHHADLAAFLAEQHIALRVGEHCAKPYLHYLEEIGTVRISLAHYNNEQDLDQFFNALNTALNILQE